MVLLLEGASHAGTMSALFERGYTVLPEPQKVELEGSDWELGTTVRIVSGTGIKPNDNAVQALREELSERYQVGVDTRGTGTSVELSIQPGSVSVGDTMARDKTSSIAQAYRLELHKQRIRIVGNAPQGLFYGVQTLVQLVKPERGKLSLPEGNIVDWPDAPLREVFWDELEHLDHIDVIKQAIRRASFFKANSFVLRLNGHFQYASAPQLVDPYALSPAELQALTDYGLRYYVQVVPYLDGPAHINFILERDEFANLREFPESAFEMCSTNPATYKLLEGMYQDLINANKGVEYFHLSTDEAWFIGKADNDQCHEAGRAKELGSPSKLWVEFTKKTASYLQQQGRKVIFWGEEPMQAEDIPSLPAGLINGEIYSSAYNKAFREHGIQQMIYTNSQPDDPLFPAYFALSPKDQLHPSSKSPERATEVFNEISFSSGRKESDLVGVGVYAWGDLGPHPETFWLGYAVGASAAWHPGSSDPHELSHSFYRLFYGQGATNMGQLYKLMSTQAQFWASSWDSKPSGELPLIFGYSYGVGPFVPHIQTLPLPPVPTADYLHVDDEWQKQNATRVGLAGNLMGENDELLNLLYSNAASVQFNRYNLEVYLSIAKLCRQNLEMLKGLEQINADLASAEAQASKLHYTEAVAALDQALDNAAKIRDERNRALNDTTTTWYKTWFPRVREANGRHAARAPQPFVDTQTSEDARRRQEGLSYLIDREFLLPFGDWVNQVQDVRNRYASAHGLPARQGKFDWQDTATLRSRGIDREL